MDNDWLTQRRKGAKRILALRAAGVMLRVATTQSRKGAKRILALRAAGVMLRVATTQSRKAAKRILASGSSHAVIVAQPVFGSPGGFAALREALFLQMRFQEPERLVQHARDFGEEIGGVGVAGAVRSVDSFPGARA